ncbi:hypothetical protein HAX54_026234 [Datura stramonium]|uniref:Uncharacterized protein n=1 Tax=Datura stramonium TaxID=4076 RepID=A0ABS8S6W3_DATST|nr:hypothetical protein [Datura stramonium]
MGLFSWRFNWSNLQGMFHPSHTVSGHTDSTNRDSTSTDDLNIDIFGESGGSWNSPGGVHLILTHLSSSSPSRCTQGIHPFLVWTVMLLRAQKRPVAVAAACRKTAGDGQEFWTGVSRSYRLCWGFQKPVEGHLLSVPTQLSIARKSSE